MKEGSNTDLGVCCVVVNWNGWRDTLDCLASLQEQEYGNLQVVVVDNGSTDDSVERIRSAFPEARLIETGKNLGFSSGCNVGLRAALAGSAEFVWLLNNDTICPPDTLRKLVRRAMASPEAGLVGTVLFYAHDPARVQAWGRKNQPIDCVYYPFRRADRVWSELLYDLRECAGSPGDAGRGWLAL